MRIEIYPPLSIHEIGQRNNQEDSIIQWNNRLFVLCDGMGGHEHGEVASQTVCQSLVNWFEGHVNPNEPFTDNQLRTALEYAYKELDKYADGSPKQMGTTLTLLYIGSNGVTAAHMGDSRIYHIRPGEGILYQSRDHSLVFDLFQAGEITYEEMATYPQKNIITRAMTPGKDNRMRPDIIQITDIKPDDYLYLCSDGMLEQMSNNDLVSLLCSNASDKEKLQQLAAASANSLDNHSAWLIHVKDVKMEEGDEELTNEEPTARSNAINIIPKAQLENEEDDVVIVSKPPVQSMKKKKWIKIGMFLLAIILTLILVWVFLFQEKEEPDLQRPKPMMQSPILPRFNKDTTNSDTSKSRNNESAGNQQPVNAQDGNNPTWHLQNR